jgi:hypothetical protein
MGSSVSQIQYWRSDGASDNTTEGGPGAVYLSYNVFLGLSVLGGFLGLDHLYLRSPLTFIAKFIVNLFKTTFLHIRHLCICLPNSRIKYIEFHFL